MNDEIVKNASAKENKVDSPQFSHSEINTIKTQKYNFTLLLVIIYIIDDTEDTTNITLNLSNIMILQSQ